MHGLLFYLTLQSWFTSKLRSNAFFVNNFNNFGIFYFLRGGLYNEGYFLASDTDLLINWLYNLSIDNNYYGIGAAISLIIFVITSAFSLLTYVRSNAYKKEDTYR